MKTVKQRIIKTTTRYEFTTEDIEELIREKCGLVGIVDFNWHIGQWVSLDVRVTTEVEDSK